MADSNPENFNSSLIASFPPSHPLYLHPWDDPGAVLVSEPFNGEGFDRWKRSMLIALSARNKLCFIDGKMEKPLADSPLHDQWMRCNDMVISWILNALIKDIAQTVIYSQTAKEIWTELEERFGEANNEKLYLIQKEISALSQSNLGIAAYYNKAKILWDELSDLDVIPVCTCQGCKCDARASLLKFQQNQKVIQFLMGLNDSYANVRRNILMMSPLPSMAQVYSLLIQEEKERKWKANAQFLTESASFDVISQRQQPPKSKNEARKPTVFCDFCRRQGHTIEKCFKLHGYPSNSKNTKGRKYDAHVQAEQEPQKSDSETIVPGLNSEQSRQLIALLNNVQITKNNNKISNKDFFSAKDIEKAAHFADSGASVHIVPTRMEKSSWELPMELVTEVLARLPVMSLLRFRRVCKAWCSLISSPEFASLHLSRYHNNDDNPPFLTVMQIVDDYAKSYWMLLSSDTYDYETRITGDGYAIVDRRLCSGPLYSFYPHGSSVNGLVLWSRESFDSLSGEQQKTLTLWNPMTRRAHELPTQYPPFSSCWWPPYFGLGFSHSRNDYKVVAIVTEAETSVHVYSLSTGTWRTIVEYREDIIRQLHSDGQVLIEGAIHFVSSNSEEKRSYMVSFDVDDEVFTYIDLLPELELQDRCIYPITYHDKIGLFNADNINNLCSLWVMENDGVAGSWSKVYAADIQVGPVRRMLCSKNNGQFMLDAAEGIVMYDFESGEVKKIQGLSGPGQAMVYCTLYRGSLALMQGLSWMW